MATSKECLAFVLEQFANLIEQHDGPALLLGLLEAMHPELPAPKPKRR